MFYQISIMKNTNMMILKPFTERVNFRTKMVIMQTLKNYSRNV